MSAAWVTRWPRVVAGGRAPPRDGPAPWCVGGSGGARDAAMHAHLASRERDARPGERRDCRVGAPHAAVCGSARLGASARHRRVARRRAHARGRGRARPGTSAARGHALGHGAGGTCSARRRDSGLRATRAGSLSATGSPGGGTTPRGPMHASTWRSTWRTRRSTPASGRRSGCWASRSGAHAVPGHRTCRGSSGSWSRAPAKAPGRRRRCATACPRRSPRWHGERTAITTRT